MKLYFSFSIFAYSFVSSCYGIFEEQAGERDWLIENTGVIQKALYTESSIFSASENGIIAKIDIKTGVAEWRIFLPDKSTVKAMILNDDKLFVLSQSNADPSQYGLLSSLDITTGQLYWDVALPFSGTSSIPIDITSSASSYPSVIAYDAEDKRLSVIHGNSLFFINTGGYHGGQVEWYWNADSNFVLSRLLSYSPLTLSSITCDEIESNKNDNNYSEAVALGCYIKKGDATVCSNTAILSATHSQQSIKLTLYRTMSVNTSPQSLQSSLRAGTSMSTEDKLSASDRGKSDDIIIGLSASTGDASGSGEVSVLHMGTNTTHKLVLSSSPTSSSLLTQSFDSFLTLSSSEPGNGGGDTVFLPAVKSCIATSCDVYTIVSASNGSSNSHKKEAFTYVLNSLVSCEGVSFAQLGLLQHHKGTYTKSAKCISGELRSAAAGGVSTTRSGTKLHIASAVLVGKGGAVELSQTSVTLPHIAMTGLAYVSGSANQILLVTSSGLTVALSVSGISTTTVEWMRDESLSRVHEAVMIEKPFKQSQQTQQSQSTSPTIGETAELEEMPDFLTRWRMQYNELTELTVYTIDAILALPDTIQHHVDNTIISVMKLQQVVLNKIALATGGAVTAAAGSQVPESPRVRTERRRKQQLINRQARQKHTLISHISSGSGSHSVRSVTGAEEDRLKRTRDRKFGFSKIIVCVTSAADNESQKSSSSSSSSQLRVVGIDSQHGDILWSLEPITGTSVVESAEVKWVKLVHSHIHHIVTLSLIMSMSDGSLHVWHIDPSTGLTIVCDNSVSSSGSSHQCSSDGKDNTCASATATVGGGAVYRVSLPSYGYKDVYATSIHSLSTHSYTYLLHTSPPSASVAADNSLTVTLLPLFTESPHQHHQQTSSSSTSSPSSSSLTSLLTGVYTHQLNIHDGELVSYQVIDTSTCTSGSSSGSTSDVLTQCAAVPVASVHFDPSTERIVSVTYPQSTEKIDKRYTILGDDSVLLKYLNPHTALVVTVSPPAATSEPLYTTASTVRNVLVPVCRDSGYDDSTANANNNTSSSSLPPCQLHISLVDTVSGKMLYSATHEPATGPVHATLFENTIAYSYWNAQLKRAELSTVGLFEGIIDKYGLTPFASHASAAAAAVYTTGGSGVGDGEGGVVTSDTAEEGGASVHSAFSAQTPLAAQKTYILPRTVTALAHTESARGISNKVLLLSLAPGQLYVVDMRQVHPRRPLAAPSVPEKEEGLTQYNPFVTFQSPQSVTLDTVVKGVSQIISTPTRLESTTLIFSFGGADVYLARSSQASGGFDSLASDFNHPLLVLILVALGVVAFTIRRLAIAKQLKQAWK